MLTQRFFFFVPGIGRFETAAALPAPRCHRLIHLKGIEEIPYLVYCFSRIVHRALELCGVLTKTMRIFC